MRIKGITYDTGFLSAGSSTREPFDPDLVRREMRVIRDDLHCTAVRITGGYPDRLETAARYAADAGLDVWFCPFTNGLTQDALLDLLADCAQRAERLRQTGASVVFLTGSEVSLMTTGFFPGGTLEERLAVLGDPARVRAAIPQVRARLQEFLGRAVELVRGRFRGLVSYASLPSEAVDWTLFDILATDAGYRTREHAGRFPELMRTYVSQGRAQGKPVAVTEFGCATFRGAGEGSGQGGLELIEWDGARPVRLKGTYTRDEGEQARYLGELLDVFAAEGVDAAFVYTFARYDLPHREDPDTDFDRVSAGVVKVFAPGSEQPPASARRYPDMPWEPKAAFDTLAEWYGRDGEG